MERLTLVNYPQIPHYSKIHSAFENSEAAASLKSIYRWSTFRVNETDEEWREALGPTAIDYEHGYLMVDLAVDFLAHEKDRFTEPQQRKFLLGIMLHDFGESILKGNDDSIGDVSAQIKTTEHEKKESIIARVVINSLDLDESIKEEMITAYHDVVEGGDPELNKYFKAIEKSEYVLTAMQVYLHGKWQRSIGKKGIENEIPLVGRVLVKDLPKVLENYAKEYPSIASRFRSDSKLIDEMFAHTLPWLKTAKEWAKMPEDHESLANNFEKVWKDFKKTTKVVTLRELYK